jgi:hypothetical protein
VSAGRSTLDVVLTSLVSELRKLDATLRRELV